METILSIPQIRHANSGNFFLIAGPCVIESRELCFDIAGRIIEMTDRLKIPFIFKSSYKKANRSKLDSFSGIGDKAGLEVLRDIRKTLGIPVLTDIHSAEEAYFASQYVDVLQIPAFLCRQTDLLVAAAKTGKVINIKKGQFLAPESMKFASEKIVQSGNNQIIITDRGTMFGYQDLIVDFRGIPEMRKFGFPIVLDITHSLQQPNQNSGISGGRPDMIETLARAAIAVGTNGLFIETHPEPMLAKSDGENMLRLDLLENLLEKLVKIRKTVLEIDRSN
ncbi:MAG TPA: 3-deoxy-8-phosphooctulonate synthase [Bacteroidales bacterium]|nr:3-deoxy-8-phosphooctulonate synthase [Bacteroidales bacterium]